MKHRSKVLAVTAATIIAFAVAGCGLGEENRINNSITSKSSFNGQDVIFATSMIPHHQQAVEMAQLAPSRAERPGIRALAQEIVSAQEPETKIMSDWLIEWNAPYTMNEMAHPMAGMMTSEDMAALEASTGSEFDQLFLEMIHAHHEGAIEMAQEEQATGKNPEAIALAKKIEQSQTQELESMKNIMVD